MPLSPGKTAKCLSGLFLIIIFSLIGCASGTTDSPETKTGNITGKVVASSSIVFKIAYQETLTGTVGVPGAVCTIEGTDKSATTDEQGSFTITDVSPGSYIVICKKTATDGMVYAFLKIVEVLQSETVDLGTVDIKKTGSIQGRATLADQTDHTGISVYIPGSSMQARTDASGAYLINDVPEGTYELHFEKSGYMNGKITDLPVTAGETALAEDMSLNLSTGVSGIISIENGKVYSSSRTVTVYITASDDAKLYQMSDNPNFIGAVWNPIPPTRSWIFDSDGEKRLYAKFADANGLESAPISDSIVVDTTLPANGSVSINNSASATNSTMVTLTLSATDATTSVSQMKISNNPDFTDSSWETFASQRSWTVPPGDGNKTVYVKFRDVVGNETDTVLASIILDTAMPDTPSIRIQEGSYTNNSQIHLILSASGASTIKISEDPNFTGSSPVPYATGVSWNLTAGDGNKTIYVKFIDEADNETNPVSDSVVLDTTLPTTPVIFNENQTTNQTTFEMTLSAVSVDANFANYQIKGGQYIDWTETTETGTFSFTLAQQGQNTLSIRGKDRAGNTGNAATVTISLDTLTPILSDINVVPAVTYGTISWKTSEPTTGKVEFGLNENYGTAVEDLNFTTNHIVSIAGLTSGALYHSRITSYDAGGNITISTDLTFKSLKVNAIAVGGWYTCALTTSGGVKCWGSNRSGQLGDGTTTDRYAPVDVSGLSSGVTAIASSMNPGSSSWEGGAGHTCALTTSGGVKCWGINSRGQLGDGTVTDRLTPVDVVGLSAGVTAIAAGGSHTCALIASGGVKCWGINNDDQFQFPFQGDGQLGDGTAIDRLTPVDVVGLSAGVTAIAAGVSHTCAIITSGGVKCWGANRYGQLGDGTTIDRLTPADVVGLSAGVTAIAAGRGHTCALTASGGVNCWGSNGYTAPSGITYFLGLLGDGTTTDHYTPVDVSGLSSGVTTIVAGALHTCALTTPGGVKCWGANRYGQLGDGTTTNRLTPVDVLGLSTGVMAISPGDVLMGMNSVGGHTCSVTTIGGVKCWGMNRAGQLGDGTTNDRLTPVDASGLY